MKNLFKIFKTGVFLTLVVLLTGMIAVWSLPVFAENGGGVTQLEISPATEKVLINIRILQIDANGNPDRTNPPGLDSVFGSELERAAYILLGVEMVPLKMELSESSESIMDQLEPLSAVEIIDNILGTGPTGQVTSDGNLLEGGKSIKLVVPVLGSYSSETTQTTPQQGQTLKWNWTDVLNKWNWNYVLDSALAKIKFGIPLTERELEVIEWEGLDYLLYIRDLMYLMNLMNFMDPDVITNNVRNILWNATPTATEAAGTVGQAPDTTPPPDTGGGGCSAGYHYHPGFGCEGNH